MTSRGEFVHRFVEISKEGVDGGSDVRRLEMVGASCPVKAGICCRSKVCLGSLKVDWAVDV
jgi:hypothetical protein